MSLPSRLHRCLALVLLAAVASPLAAQNTVTVTPSTAWYSTAGGTVTFAVTLTYAGNLSGLSFEIAQPAGWQFVSAGVGAGLGAVPAPGEIGNLAFVYFTIPASPAAFSFSVSYPTNQTGTKEFTGIRATFIDASANTQTVTVPNVAIGSPPIHSADTNGDFALTIAELTRVLQMWNFTSGGVRTGQYTVQAGTEDGFIPGLGGAALTTYHSADTNRDGQLSLVELTRVIALYNTRTANVRTGKYRPETGTVDGFASAP